MYCVLPPGGRWDGWKCVPGCAQLSAGGVDPGCTGAARIGVQAGIDENRREQRRSGLSPDLLLRVARRRSLPELVVARPRDEQVDQEGSAGGSRDVGVVVDRWGSLRRSRGCVRFSRVPVVAELEAASVGDGAPRLLVSYSKIRKCCVSWGPEVAMQPFHIRW